MRAHWGAHTPFLWGLDTEGVKGTVPHKEDAVLGAAEAVDEAVAATTVVAAFKAAVVDADTMVRVVPAPATGAKAKVLTMRTRVID